MSTEVRKENIPTNEEVIEEITRNLEKQAVNENEVAEEEKLPAKDLEEPVKSKETADVNVGELTTPPLTEEEKQERRQQALELKKQGNALHKDGKFLEAIDTYTEALNLCPVDDKNDCAILYCNRAASKIQLQNYTESAIEDCSDAIELNPDYVRAYLRRAKLYEETEKLDESLADYKKLLEFDPGNKDALKATIRLPPLINERNEKLKTEMFGKLKDLGNMVLKPFGLSTENFKMQQDPNTGSYSINFQQNGK